MAELFIPKPLDLLTPAINIKQLQQQGQFREQQLGQGQQRLDLLRENLSFRREQETSQQTQQQFQNILNTTGKLIDLKLNSQAVDHLNANKDILGFTENINAITSTEKAGTYKVDTAKGTTIIALERDAQGNYTAQAIETGVKAKTEEKPLTEFQTIGVAAGIPEEKIRTGDITTAEANQILQKKSEQLRRADSVTKLKLVMKAVGLDPQKGLDKLSSKDADRVIEKYKKEFGAESILELLFGGQLPPTPTGGLTDDQSKRLEELRQKRGE